MSQNGNDEKSSSILETVGAFFSAKGLILVTAGGIGYFLGWRFLYAYYGDFGLDPIFFSFSPTDVISSGWRIYVIIALLTAFVAVLLETVRYVAKNLLDKRQITRAFYLFLFFLVLGAVLISIVIYRFIFVYAAHISLGFYTLAFSALACLWLSFGIGEKLHEIDQKENKLWHPGLFRVLFPSPILWLTIISMGCIITLAFFSSWLGLTYSKRDQSNSSRLQIAKLCVDKQLALPNGQQINENEWCYSDLRFLYEADQTYFVFRTSEVSFDATTLYAIPQESVVEFWLQPWHVTVTSAK